MPQNRKKLIELFIGNVSNAVIHKILEKAIIDNEEIIDKYNKESLLSLKIAASYRQKINPIKTILPEKDKIYIKNKVTSKVKLELNIRIAKGYKNIDLSLIEIFVNETLKDFKI